MRALESITGHVIYKPAYTYKFQLKTTLAQLQLDHLHPKTVGMEISANFTVNVAEMENAEFL